MTPKAHPIARQPPPDPPPIPAYDPAQAGTITHIAEDLVDSAGRFVVLLTETDWRRMFLRWCCVVQVVYLVTLILPGRNIPRLVEDEFGLSPLVFAFLFAYGAGHFSRGLRPRFSLATAFVGQGLYAVFAVYYAVRGEASWTVLAAHGGTFLVLFVGAMALAQDTVFNRYKVRVRLHNLLMPCISTTLGLYALGIAAQPHVGIAGWLESQLGTPPLVILGFALALASGYVFHNHISAEKLFAALVPDYMYVIFAVWYFLAVPGVAPVAIASHIVFAVSASLVVILQTRENNG